MRCERGSVEEEADLKEMVMERKCGEEWKGGRHIPY